MKMVKIYNVSNKCVEGVLYKINRLWEYNHRVTSNYIYIPFISITCQSSLIEEVQNNIKKNLQLKA